MNKVAELAYRCGVSPSIVEVKIKLEFTGEVGHQYRMSGFHGGPGDDGDRADHFFSLLGMDNAGVERVVANLHEAEQIVDQALSKVPRSRLR